MDIIYTDKDIVLCIKPAGVLSTDEAGGLPELLRAELGTKDIRTVHRHDGVAAGLVDAGDHPPAPIQAEGGVDLVPVLQGLLHAHDLLHMAEAAQQGDLSFLFMQKLPGIAHVLQLAAAAGAALGTAVFFALFHFQ